MKTKVTYKELMIFAATAPSVAKAKPDTKFSKTLEGVVKANKALMAEYYDEVDMINLDAALVDEKTGKIIYEDVEKGIYAMSKEGKKKQLEDIRKLNQKKVSVTFKRIDAKDVPADLPEDLKAVFTPFVFEPEAEAIEGES